MSSDEVDSLGELENLHAKNTNDLKDMSEDELFEEVGKIGLV